MSNILVVEDDLLTLHSIVDLLSAEKFQVTGVADGNIALEIIKQKKFDLILCDLLLPGANGYEILSFLRKDLDTADIPFMVLTGKSKREDIRLGLKVGVSEYITKPFVNQKLIKSIQAQLEKKKFLEKCYQAKDRAFTPKPQQKHPLYYDRVTKIPNQLCLRDKFENIVSKYVEQRIELNSSGKKSSNSIAVCCVSLDCFEEASKSLKREQSDSILRIASQRLINSIGNKAKIMRLYDEDERGDFVIIFPYVSYLKQAIKAVEAIRAALSEPFQVEEQTVRLTPYAGISFYPHHGKEIELLLKRARQAVAKAQQNSEDCYEVYRPNLAAFSEYKSLALVDDLRRAMQNHELNVYYQPQVNLLKGKVVGCEALLRWNHPRRGNIPPATFISIAEDIDLIESLETWLLRTACQQLKIWQQKGFGPIKLAINLSSRQFVQHDCTSRIAEALKRVRLAPESLAIELTENTLVKDCKNSIAILSDFKSLGIDVTLDNFGRGYSSLGYLQQFPFQTLKVDLHYLNSFFGQSNSRLALKYIIKMAQRLKIKLIVEKVETSEQLSFLRQHQFVTAQGYFLSLPLPVDEFDELLQGKCDWLSTLFSFPPI